MITRDEWLKALEDAQPPAIEGDEDAKTADEIAAMLGVSISTARRTIAKMVQQGRAVSVRKRKRDVVGRMLPVSAYKLVPVQ